MSHLRDTADELQIICSRILSDWTKEQDVYGLREAVDAVRVALNPLEGLREMTEEELLMPSAPPHSRFTLVGTTICAHGIPTDLMCISCGRGVT